jgi:TolB-like protein
MLDALVVLLSANAVESHNVAKELTLASEKRKKILPIVIERTELPASFQYPLAGLHHVSLNDFSAIERALEYSEGVAMAHSNSSFLNRSRQIKRFTAIVLTLALAICIAFYSFFLKPGSVPIVASNDSLSALKNRTLVIIPLEDLSPGHNLAWFADGLMSELIGSLSSIKALRLIDQTTSLQYKNRTKASSEISRELKARYMMEGSIRSSGAKFKIALELLDCDSGTFLWREEFKGTLKDVLTIQESIASRVLSSMQVKLTDQDAVRLFKHGHPKFDPRPSQVE